MEALNVLRIEKGFITHAEIHGRTTAYDIGLQAWSAKRKTASARPPPNAPGLMEPERERLIGLKPTGVVKQLTAGAHLFNAGDEATRENDQGYVTSVAFSRRWAISSAWLS